MGTIHGRSCLLTCVITAILVCCFVYLAGMKPIQRDCDGSRPLMSRLFVVPSIQAQSKWTAPELSSEDGISSPSLLPSRHGTQEPSLESLRDAAQCSTSIPDAEKFDCHPEALPTPEKCQARGCCWSLGNTQLAHSNSGGAPEQQMSLGVPWCYYPLNYPGYVVTNRTKTNAGLIVDLRRNTSTYYPGAIREIQMHVFMETQQRLHIKILDPHSERYEVPYLNTQPSDSAAIGVLYSVHTADVGEPFTLTVTRNTSSGNVTLLRTAGAFMFNDQFLQLSYFLPSNYVYGLGEHRDRLLHSVQWSRFTLWNRDEHPEENRNLYGSHPFYLMMEPEGTSHGFFLVNSNAMDVILQPAPAITWRTIGGVLDFYLFLGPEPDQVIQQYTEVIGRSFMPPYWSLGFHLCRWGYRTARDTLAVMDRVRQAGVPQDVQWNDLDYMEEKRDFTTGWKTFGNQTALVEEVHKRGMHYVMIVDPGISSTQPPGSYPPFDQGLQMGVFINDTEGEPLIGKVWPGNTAFPDFTHPQAHSYWREQVEVFHRSVPFDGLWIDMNEISNFVSGSIKGCPENNIENPPYLPAVLGGSLKSRTICASAQQHLSAHYNLHNLYGFTETMASYEALAAVRKKRPFVISRSTFSGQGRYGGHWSGDNFAFYHDMYRSISEVLNMNMFGVSMAGADICGFSSPSTEQLCQRWYQLGAFYTFSRNHNDFFNPAKDPAAFGEAFANSTRNVLLTRYSLLPYLYTLMHKSSTMGHTVLRPLFFEFPQDTRTYGIDTQFLWGPWLLITPVLDKDRETVEGYFPAGLWYDFYNGSRHESQGEAVLVDAPKDKLNLHVRAGGILPLQLPALTTTLSRRNSFQLLVALGEGGVAGGELYWDDGDSLDTHTKGAFNRIIFSAKNNTITSTIPHCGYTAESMVLNNVTIFGVGSAPHSVEVNSRSAHVQYVQQSQVLYVTGFQATLTQPFKLVWN